MSKIAVLTSGGDSPGMNAGIRAVVRTAIYDGHEVVGIRDGYCGIFNGLFEEMNLSSVADIIHRGGTILGTSRCDRMEREEGIEKAVEILQENKIDLLIVLGGDGSMRGALELSKKGIRVATLPATIDNDLGYQEESIGFFTAIDTITEAIGRIRDTSSAHNRGNIVEVMGRKCGDLALYAGIAGGAESILVPEIPMDLEKVMEKVKIGKNRGKRHHIILITEDLIDAEDLAKKVEEETGVVTRVTVLGYIQRGGNPIIKDRINASILGEAAVRSIKDEKTAVALGIYKGRVRTIELEEALSIKKEIDLGLYETMQILSI
ncbi:6-phosphofructokinase [Peptoniphilus sp. KCTC 25270]|uniref:ATP-dependent 6-phosphofructokinase n=1 Tax=Peptoniphilus sp. KCTC 25270 TaxID=2897414 RepID=UPI001E55C05A|nr:ATP-dependent 6-phosphofructokinase [Peptoniphilus sp. KCTC 25270]MCD1146723.1 6-phosphofructokinase [Peptoniphilus sp. KCTC 25270]